MIGQTFGNQTITVVSITTDTTHLDRYGKPALVRTETPVHGCLFRAMNPTFRDEKVGDLGDVTIDQWKGTLPPDPAALALKANDEVIVNGITYEVQVGARSYYGFGGSVYKATIIVQKRGG